MAGLAACRRKHLAQTTEGVVHQFAQGFAQILVGVDELQAHKVDAVTRLYPGHVRDGLKILFGVVFIYGGKNGC